MRENTPARLNSSSYAHTIFLLLIIPAIQIGIPNIGLARIYDGCSERKLLIGDSVSLGAVGTKLSYPVPTGKSGIVLSSSQNLQCSNCGQFGIPMITADFQIVRGSATISVPSTQETGCATCSNFSVILNQPISLEEGDIFRLNQLNANSNTVTADLSIEILECDFKDQDNDGVRDERDNCIAVPNGPSQASNQLDFDKDGIGTACDADYDQSATVTVVDFGTFNSFLGQSGFTPTDPAAEVDHDGSGTITNADFSTLLNYFGSPITGALSGLTCANPLLVVPPAAPCVAP